MKKISYITITAVYFHGKFNYGYKNVGFDDWTDAGCLFREGDEQKAHHEMLRLMRRGGKRTINCDHWDRDITYRKVVWKSEED